MRVGAYILCGPFGWLVKYRFHGRRLVGSGGRSRGEGYRDHGGMRWGKNQSRTMPITIHPAKAPGRDLRHSTTNRMRIDPRNSLHESVPSVPQEFEVRATKIYPRSYCHNHSKKSDVVSYVIDDGHHFPQPGAVEKRPRHR